MTPLNPGPIKSVLPPGKWQYFMHKVALPSEGKFLHIYGEPGPDKLLICASSETAFPDERSGDTTADRLRNRQIIADVPTELNPFLIDSRSKLTFRCELADILAESGTPDKNSVGLKVEGDYWRYMGDICYIAAKNVSQEEITFTISAQGIVDTHAP